MGIMYSWATKEYLLEQMTFGQIVMYLNHGIEIKYPKPEKKPGEPEKLTDKSSEELTAYRDKLREQYGIKSDGADR